MKQQSKNILVQLKECSFRSIWSTSEKNKD